MAELVRLLADPAVRLVTILAPGGMGKTRLGLAVAERQLSRFPDGVVFVALAPLSSPDDIVTTIAEQVGLNFSGNAPPKAQLLEYFRERHILLVLDNFEHLLAGADLRTLHAAQTADYESPAPAESVRLWQAVGDPFYLAYALTRNVFARPDNLEYIIACLRQSAQIQRETGNWIHVCTSLMYMAELLVLTGAPDEAGRLLDEVVRIQHEIGMDRFSIFVLSIKAHLAFWRGELDTAIQHERQH